MAFPPVEPLPDIYVGGKKRDKTAYLHKPPVIQPNYGQKTKHGLLPKTHIARVLLYENTMQDNILDVQLNYITHQKRSFRFVHSKHRYAFIDMLKHRQKWHEIWETGYQRMKDAYIAQYGTRYMPVPTPEPEVDPFIFNARLAPPINVLCFYLDSQQQGGKKNKQSMAEYDHDHDRLVNCRDSEPLLYTHSTEDPRFRRLKECLAPPLFHTDGYNQLSPDYCKTGVKVKKAKRQSIVLPKFYARPQIASRESVRSRSPSGKDSVKKNSVQKMLDTT